MYVYASTALAYFIAIGCKQTCYPNQILIIDGSTDEATQKVIAESTFVNLQYYKYRQKHADSPNKGTMVSQE
jgi:hypothetical protein